MSFSAYIFSPQTKIQAISTMAQNALEIAKAPRVMIASKVGPLKDSKSMAKNVN